MIRPQFSLINKTRESLSEINDSISLLSERKKSPKTPYIRSSEYGLSLLRAHVHEDFCKFAREIARKSLHKPTVNNNKKYAQIIPDSAHSVA